VCTGITIRVICVLYPRVPKRTPAKAADRHER